MSFSSLFIFDERAGEQNFQERQQQINPNEGQAFEGYDVDVEGDDDAESPDERGSQESLTYETINDEGKYPEDARQTKMDQEYQERQQRVQQQQQQQQAQQQQREEKELEEQKQQQQNDQQQQQKQLQQQQQKQLEDWKRLMEKIRRQTSHQESSKKQNKKESKSGTQNKHKHHHRNNVDVNRKVVYKDNKEGSGNA